LERFRVFWAHLRDSLWFVPAVFTLAGGVLAVLLVEMSERYVSADRHELWWLLGDSSDGARGILSAIAGSLITVTGTVFSVTIIALQLTSQQFTPRVLRNFMADRSNQVVLGVLIGTFTYSLIVMRSIRASNDDVDAIVPVVAVTGGMVLALVSVGFLIYFIHHVARSIQVTTIMDRVAETTEATIERLFGGTSEDDERFDHLDDEPVDLPDVPALPLRSRGSGYVQAIDHGRIVELAEAHELTLRAEITVGDFVIEGSPLASLWSRGTATDDVLEKLVTAVVLGAERTPFQDVEIGIIELVDVAVKAMSPSVNDPTTAVQSLNRIGQVLVRLGRTLHARGRYRTADGRVCLMLRTPTFDGAVELAFDQIRHYSQDNAMVMERMFRVIGEVASLVKPAYWPPLAGAVERGLLAVEKSITHPADRERALAAGRAALGRCGRPGAAG
jgi:uncharacterized membrane protein